MTRQKEQARAGLVSTLAKNGRRATMLIQFTEEERLHFQEIKDSYQPERERLLTALDAAETKGDRKERDALLVKLQALTDSLETELYSYSDKCQRQRFKLIDGGAAGIIENAREQIPQLLEAVHADVTQEAKYFLPEDLSKLKVGTLKDGRLLVNTGFALDYLREELQLHIEALIDDKAALRELLEIMVEATEVSHLTDTSEISADEDKLVKVKRRRRRPLADIKDYGLMNDKASYRLLQDADIFKKQTNGQLTLQWAVNQAPQKQAQVPVYIALTYQGDVSTNKSLSAYDTAVYNAVATRYYYWNIENPDRPLYITPQEVWRTMNGKRSGDGKAKPSAKQLQRVCDSLDKMRFTRCYMDISKEIQAYDLRIDDERITGGKFDSYLLNSSKVEFTTDKGNIVSGYRIAEEPLLYTYNQAKNHILYVPYEMLDTSAQTSDGENVTEFRQYLLQQIQLMKYAADTANKGKGYKRNNIILLATIYESTGILPPEERIADDYANETTRQQLIRRTRKADRQKVEGILEAWKVKGWIKGYTALNNKSEQAKERQAVKGYRISL